jgi:hypothetical protein
MRSRLDQEKTMEELIGRLTANVGIDDATAREAVRIILSFLYQEGPRERVTELAEKIPGAAAYIDDSDPDSSATLGGLGGLMGGGAMEVLGKLQSLGLGMGEIQGVTQEVVNFAREKAGPGLINEIIGSIPGLGQFV